MNVFMSEGPISVSEGSISQRRARMKTEKKKFELPFM
jgi:hypothetical protein